MRKLKKAADDMTQVVMERNAASRDQPSAEEASVQIQDSRFGSHIAPGDGRQRIALCRKRLFGQQWRPWRQSRRIQRLDGVGDTVHPGRDENPLRLGFKEIDAFGPRRLYEMGPAALAHPSRTNEKNLRNSEMGQLPGELEQGIRSEHDARYSIDIRRWC